MNGITKGGNNKENLNAKRAYYVSREVAFEIGDLISARRGAEKFTSLDHLMLKLLYE